MVITIMYTYYGHKVLCSVIAYVFLDGTETRVESNEAYRPDSGDKTDGDIRDIRDIRDLAGSNNTM